MNKIRLQKFFTDNEIMSRRNAEKVIEAGNVKVNGIVAHLGDKVDPLKDVIEYNEITVKPITAKKRYIMLNKPLGYVTTTSDEKSRKTVMDLLDGIDERLYPVGRLDMFSEGLLILTNDGELTNRLTHPKNSISKKYSVLIRGEISPETLHTLTSPMVLDGYTIKPVHVRIVSFRNNITNAVFILNEGRNRQIRKMCEQCSLSVIKLTRIAVGKLELGDLPKGKFRDLTDKEIQYLQGKKNIDRYED